MDWVKKHKIATGIIVFVIFAGIIGGSSGSKNQSTANTKQTKSTHKTATAKTTQPKSKFQTLKDVVGSDATLFVANSTVYKQAESEADAPFKIVINNTDLVGCSSAKTASYNIIKSVYSNSDIKGLVDQIVITYPNRLVTSLGGDDGRSVNSWSGETNFYKVMFDNFQTSQRDPVGKKTWAIDIGNCK